MSSHGVEWVGGCDRCVRAWDNSSDTVVARIEIELHTANVITFPERNASLDPSSDEEAENSEDEDEEDQGYESIEDDDEEA